MNDLPNEILLKILLKIPIPEIKNLIRVCHLWHKIIDNKYFWKLTYQMEFSLPKKNDLTWKQMIKDYALVIRSNLNNPEYIKRNAYNLNTLNHHDFIDQQFYDHDKNLLLVASHDEINIYNLDKYFTKKGMYDISDGFFGKYTTIKRKISNVHQICTINNFIILAPNDRKYDIGTAKINAIEIEYDSNNCIDEKSNFIINTNHLVIAKIGIMDNLIISSGINDMFVYGTNLYGETVYAMETGLDDISAMNCSENMIMLGTEDGLVKIYDYSSRTLCAEYELYNPSFYNKINKISYDPNKNLVVCAATQYFCGFDLRSSKPLFRTNIPKFIECTSSWSRLHGTEQNCIENMQLYDGNILWSSLYTEKWKDTGNLHIYKLTDCYNNNYSQLHNNKCILSGVSAFQMCGIRLFASTVSGYACYSFCDMIQ